MCCRLYRETISPLNRPYYLCASKGTYSTDFLFPALTPRSRGEARRKMLNNSITSSQSEVRHGKEAREQLIGQKHFISINLSLPSLSLRVSIFSRTAHFGSITSANTINTNFLLWRIGENSQWKTTVCHWENYSLLIQCQVLLPVGFVNIVNYSLS